MAINQSNNIIGNISDTKNPNITVANYHPEEVNSDFEGIIDNLTTQEVKNPNVKRFEDEIGNIVLSEGLISNDEIDFYLNQYKSKYPDLSKEFETIATEFKVVNNYSQSENISSQLKYLRGMIDADSEVKSAILDLPDIDLTPYEINDYKTALFEEIRQIDDEDGLTHRYPELLKKPILTQEERQARRDKILNSENN